MQAMIVTGGAGFIGSNFVRSVLAHTEMQVVVVDKLTYAGNLASLQDVQDQSRFSFVQADIADRSAMEELVRKVQPQLGPNFCCVNSIAPVMPWPVWHKGFQRRILRNIFLL